VKKIGIIEILREQLRVANETIQKLLLRIDDLQDKLEERDARIAEIQASLKSMEASLALRNEEVKKQQRIVKGISKIVENKSEKVVPEAPQEKQDPKERGNNNAKRDMRLDMKVEIHDIYPQQELIEGQEVKELAPRESVRYEYIPAQFIKHIYRQHCYLLSDDKIIRAKLPLAPLQNSSFDGSFIAGIMELRYIYSMPVERITSYFNDHGFHITKGTLNGLLQKTADLFEKLYKALGNAVLEDEYIAGDETYMKVMIKEALDNGKHIKKAYIWDLIAKNLGLIYYFYDEGSRSGKVIEKVLKEYRGVLQSDGYAPYRKLGSNQYPNIKRLPCLQHIKRKFKNAEGEPDADLIYQLINQLYQYEHQHTIGEAGWTESQNLKWRQKYAPPILDKIEKELNRIIKRPDLDPQGDLYEATKYMLNEMEDVKNIFQGGAYDLDNNEVERYNRYISLSRRNSLFFGSHNGAQNGAILYSLACSCRMQGLNFFEYITDVLNQRTTIPDGAGSEAYRHLLPDKWKENRMSENQ